MKIQISKNKYMNENRNFYKQYMKTQISKNKYMNKNRNFYKAIYENIII